MKPSSLPFRWSYLAAVGVSLGACEPTPGNSVAPGERGSKPLATAVASSPGAPVGQVGVVATVGSAAIRAESLVAAARAQNIGIDAALQASIFDALLAQGARQLHPRESRLAEQRLLARAMVRSLWLKAQTDPISDEELEEATQKRFAEFDRPRGWRVVHALVRIDQRRLGKRRAAAQALAQELASKAVAAAELAKKTTAPVFEGKAAFSFRVAEASKDPVVGKLKEVVESLATEGQSLLSEPLPVIAPDGRFIDFERTQGAGVVRKFVAALATLKTRGDMVGPVETQFGYHVVILLSTTDPAKVAKKVRLARLGDSIRRLRASMAQTKLLRERSTQNGVRIFRNADAILAQVVREGAKRAAGRSSQ